MADMVQVIGVVPIIKRDPKVQGHIERGAREPKHSPYAIYTIPISGIITSIVTGINTGIDTQFGIDTGIYTQNVPLHIVFIRNKIR